MDHSSQDPRRLALAAGLALAFVVAYPANLWLIRRGAGHARMQAHH